MEWTPDLAVGIETIDIQHQELFRRINDLLVSIKEKRCTTEIDGMIRFLDDYARYHFSEEERRMEGAGYEELAEHRAYHAVYLRNLEFLKQLAAQPRVQGMSYELSVTTNQIVVDWIVDHIMRIDRKFGEFVRRKNKGPGARS